MSAKRVSIMLVLAVFIAGLSACTITVGGNDGVIRKTLKGDKNITGRAAPLTDSEYELVIEDIVFAGNNSTGRIIIGESLDNTAALETDGNILDTIDISVSDGRITVKGDRAARYDHTQFELRIGAKISGFTINGGFELDMDAPSVTNFSGLVNGAVDARMAFGSLDSFSLNVNGACSISLTGEAERSSILINGAGNIEAFDFRAADSSVTMNGAGSCNVYASETLDISMSGVGSVVYDGSPKTVNTGAGILGTVRKR